MGTDNKKLRGGIQDKTPIQNHWLLLYLWKNISKCLFENKKASNLIY